GLASGKSDHKVGLSVVRFVEGLDIFERQLLERTDGAHVVMLIGMAVVDQIVKVFFAKLFIVTFPQRNLQEVQCISSQASEIVCSETGIEQHLIDQSVV